MCESNGAVFLKHLDTHRKHLVVRVVSLYIIGTLSFIMGLYTCSLYKLCEFLKCLADCF